MPCKKRSETKPNTVVSALILPLRDNPDLAASMQVGVVNQAGGYELLTATEQGLQQAEPRRRSCETADMRRARPIVLAAVSVLGGPVAARRSRRPRARRQPLRA